jgi:hypothetical protein
MVNTDRSANDNQDTTVTTGLGHNSNAATDSGNFDTKTAATAVEPGHDSTALPLNDAKAEHVKPDTASESGVEDTDPEARKAMPQTERPEGERVRDRIEESSPGDFEQSLYGYRIPPQMPESFSSLVKSMHDQSNHYGTPPQMPEYRFSSFGKNKYSQPHHYGIPPQSGFSSFGKSMYGQPRHYGMHSTSDRGYPTGNGGYATGYGVNPAYNGGFPTGNGGDSTYNRGHFPAMYMQPGPQGFQMYQGPPGSSMYHNFRCPMLANLVQSTMKVTQPITEPITEPTTEPTTELTLVATQS